MSGIEKCIEEVQRKHREELHEEGICICGWHADVETDYPVHVAAAVVQALGLKQESNTYEKFETKSECGGSGNLSWGSQTIHSLGWRTSTRLVSDWVES